MPRHGDPAAMAKEDPAMFAFLAQIAFRVYRTHPPRNKRNLRIKQCFISGAADLGLTDRAYRTLTQRAVKLGEITVKPTSKGTVFELISTVIFDINEVAGDEHPMSKVRSTDEHPMSGEIEEPSPNPHEHRAEAVLAVFRQEWKKEEPKIDPSLMRVREEQAVELPDGFPDTKEKALAMCSTCGVPPEFIIDTWKLAMSRGGRGGKDIPIRSWPHHVMWMHSCAGNRKAERSHKSQPEPNERVEHIPVRILEI